MAPSQTQDVDKLTLTVFREVWNEFYAWKHSACEAAIQKLAATDEAIRLAKDDYAGLFDSAPARISETPSDFVVYDFCSKSTSNTSTIFINASSITPASQYESCAPIPRNVLHGDDPNEMAFVPYADDTNFNEVDYAMEYKNLSWQVDNDPDIKWISLETARRLSQSRGIDLDLLDGCKLLKFPLLSSPSSTDPGLIWFAKMNDPPAWPPLQSIRSVLRDIAPPAEDDWRKRLQNHLSLFCSNLNCIEAHCWSHENEVHDLTNDPRHTTPSASAYPPEASTPCDSSCYLSSHPETPDLSPIWTETDLDNLSLLFSISKDETSCDIAAVAQTPCWKVHAERKIFLSKHTWSSTTLPNLGLQPSKFTSRTPTKSPQFQHCSHEGPCDTTTKCRCSAASGYCERTCCCPNNCSRRWKGCQCATTRGKRLNLCLSSRRCPCFLQGRECDPELCDCCNNDTLDTQTLFCQNVPIQRNQAKSLKVQRSKWGFGVCLREDARANEFICEYKGELIFPPTLNTRDKVAKHRGRSYVYALNAEYDNDGSYAGNESRFFNHAKGQKTNCAVTIKVVNGEHRIGVYAKRNIPAGTELFLDYGPEFTFN